MSCPRLGEKCKEFSCGSSIDGICIKRPLPPPPLPLRKVGMFREENKNLADFKTSVENIASMYAKIVENQLKDKKSIDVKGMLSINEGIKNLNYIANVIEIVNKKVIMLEKNRLNTYAKAVEWIMTPRKTQKNVKQLI